MMNFPYILNDKFAEFVGVLLGDGSIGIYNSQYRIKITTNSVDDLEYAHYVSNLIYSLFGRNPLLRFRKNEQTLDILLFSKEIVTFLTQNVGLSIAPKYNQVRIPDSFLRGHSELLILRGLFDTDGCVVITDNNGTIYPRLELKIIKSPMRQQVVDILQRNGFRFILSPSNPNARQVRIQLNGVEQLQKWVNKVGFSNKKHSNKVSKFLYTKVSMISR